MSDAFEQTAPSALLEAIAAALRLEFASGDPIEEQPGGRDPSGAGQVNRAFRVVALVLLQADADRADRLGQVLDRLLRRRLEQGGAYGRSADALIATAQGRHDWLIYFLLTPWSEIEHELASAGRGHE